MSDEAAEVPGEGAAGACGRCGARLGRGAVHIAFSAVDGPEPAALPPLAACRDCVKSLSRWVDRGRARPRPARKPRAARPEKKRSSRHGRFRPDRQQVALAVVVMLGLAFSFYLYQSFQ